MLRGRVFRSGHLGTLADDLRAEVAALGLRTVVTLQTRQEIEILGDPIAALLPETRWEHIPIGDRWFQKGSLLPDDTSSQGAFYVAMVRDHAEEWTRFLRLFARSRALLHPLSLHRRPRPHRRGHSPAARDAARATGGNRRRLPDFERGLSGKRAGASGARAALRSHRPCRWHRAVPRRSSGFGRTRSSRSART